VKSLIKRLAVVLAITALLGEVANAASNPVGDFFKRLGRSISKAGKPQPARHTSRKSSSKRTAVKEAKASPSPVGPSPAPEPMSSPTPSFAPSVRVASVAPPAKGKKRDSPFGIPVPGKQGFVTSPFSPDGHHVDVRAFPPGSEVKDPYTGKIFRVP
jgi:hypothetical protein